MHDIPHSPSHRHNFRSLRQSESDEHFRWHVRGFPSGPSVGNSSLEPIQWSPFTSWICWRGFLILGPLVSPSPTLSLCQFLSLATQFRAFPHIPVVVFSSFYHTRTHTKMKGSWNVDVEVYKHCTKWVSQTVSNAINVLKASFVATIVVKKYNIIALSISTLYLKVKTSVRMLNLTTAVAIMSWSAALETSKCPGPVT